MNKNVGVTRTFLSVFLVVFSLNAFAQNILYEETNSAQNNVISNDSGEEIARDIKADGTDYSELDVKKAIIYTRLHYGWKMTEHSRFSMTLEYKNSVIRLDIDGANVKIINLAPDQQLGSKWLARFEKLYLRRLNFYKDVKEASAFIQ